jgi:hypothetical protein
MASRRLFAFEISDETSVFAVTDAEAKALAAQQAANPLGHFEAAASIVRSTMLRPCAADGSEITDKAFAPKDYGIWGLCAVFSKAAVELLCACGAKHAEFCRAPLTTNPSATAYVFVPSQLRDFLDSRSIRSKHVLPLQPPMPFWITQAEIRSGVEDLPPLFMNMTPAGNSWLPEHFATERIVRAWEARGLRGARFRDLSQQAA